MNSVKIFISTDGTEQNGYAFGDNYIKDIKFSRQLMDTTFNINPTVIEQYAEITFKDKSNYIFNLVKKKILFNDMKVFLYINGILTDTYLTSSWDIQLQSSSIALHCNDLTKRLENIQTQLVNVATRTLYQLIDIGFGFSTFSWEAKDAETLNILNNTIIPDSYVQYQDLLTYLKKLCIVGFLRIYWKKDRFIVARCYA